MIEFKPQFVSPIASWQQGSPYNMYTKLDNGCGTCSRKDVGCGAVATGMIVRYHLKEQINMTIVDPATNKLITMNTDLKNAPRTISGYSTTPCIVITNNFKQIPFLLRWVGGKINSDYGVLGNCATWTVPGNINNGLVSMGFSNGGTWGSLSSQYASLKSDLKSGYPCILTGTLNMVNTQNAHTWVADGYKSETCGTTKTEWVGFCWGWGDYWNGYFIADYSFYTGENNGDTQYSKTYDTYLRALTGIRK